MGNPKDLVSGSMKSELTDLHSEALARMYSETSLNLSELRGDGNICDLTHGHPQVLCFPWLQAFCLRPLATWLQSYTNWIACDSTELMSTHKQKLASEILWVALVPVKFLGIILGSWNIWLCQCGIAFRRPLEMGWLSWLRRHSKTETLNKTIFEPPSFWLPSQHVCKVVRMEQTWYTITSEASLH